ncbi:hypothetical protein OM427_26150 [Halomonas sp. 18H]|uniref:hypothetical protein n=1 Tax=Halomonas almeriensis TaxID=308163 RepID=UPI00222E9AE4|nr:MULTISPECIES: hypothetical protein [Halomonas]MCW4152998.1 hypothetical protein [Halomonas sp. 18H]MDN3554319.1 hypothetical protein [Halomonas almeriensis]
MHKHIEWEAPGADSVMDHFAKHPDQHSAPRPGDILSARYRGSAVRIKVEAYVEGVSIGSVAAIIDLENGQRRDAHHDLSLGDTVRLPDEKRAMEPNYPDEDDDAQD